MSAWWLGVFAVIVAGVVAAVILVSGFAADRSAADACWAAGGVPVQGDAVAGDSVVCLDSSVRIEVTP